jgi:hypothetical protein
MPASKVITPGQSFGRWTVIREVEGCRTAGGTPLRQVLCKCMCGTQKTVRFVHLTSGRVLSCGCLRSDARQAQRISIAAGQRFGRLSIVAEESPKLVGTRSIRRFRCKCDCGKTTVVNLQGLRAKTIKSCGCLRQELSSARNTTHGHTRGQHGKRTISRSYSAWKQMRARCQRPAHAYFKHYGGRGIKVCERWQKFENFLADMGEPPQGTSLDRLNNDGDYEPANCAWRTQVEQMYNRRTTIHVLFQGERLSLRDWSERTGIPRATLHNRIVLLSWAPERALTTPHRPKLYRVTRERKHDDWLKLKDFAP